MSGVKLKERSIYKLPDGRHFIVCASGRDSYSLYPAQNWREFSLAEYRLHTDGRILSKGTPTRWRVEDLTDTGQVAQPIEH